MDGFPNQWVTETASQGCKTGPHRLHSRAHIFAQLYPFHSLLCLLLYRFFFPLLEYFLKKSCKNCFQEANLRHSPSLCLITCLLCPWYKGIFILMTFILTILSARHHSPQLHHVAFKSQFLLLTFILFYLLTIFLHEP